MNNSKRITIISNCQDLEPAHHDKYFASHVVNGKAIIVSVHFEYGGVIAPAKR